MLLGNLSCAEIKNCLLKYIDYKLPKNKMKEIAIHLRNCPKCMEKYTKIKKRKSIIKMQNSISSYIDMETNEGENFFLENKFLNNEKYKQELKSYEKISSLLHKSRLYLKEKIKPENTEKTIQKIIKYNKSPKEKFIRIFQQLLRVLPGFQ